MSFEFFKAFPPDYDGPVVEVNVRRDGQVEIPAEVRRESGGVRVRLFARSDGLPWNYDLDELLDALRRAAEILDE